MIEEEKTWVGDEPTMPSGSAPSGGELEALSKLADALVQTREHIERLERETKEAKDKERDLSEHRIPQAMEAVGMAEIRTTNGFRIQIADKIRASITKAREREAIAWLEDNGHGDIIKRTVAVMFDRGEDVAMEALCAELRSKGLPVKPSAAVHHSTLAALVKELLESGEDVPFDTLGVFVQRVTKIEK
jgi:hypothetical protein